MSSGSSRRTGYLTHEVAADRCEEDLQPQPVSSSEEGSSSGLSQDAVSYPPQDAAQLPPVAIPDKRYFRIGEVAELLSVKPHVLRYWESEFRQLQPNKTRRGQRLYRRKEVEIAAMIRHLLHGERYTIAGARERLRAIAQGRSPAPCCLAPPAHRLEMIIEEVEGIRRLLDRRERDLEGR
ncbi:MAG: MerR family transcriptional regulator [Myxococcota bacterium]